MHFRRLWPWLSLLLAVVLLNAGLTFHNVWPTLGIRWPGELSIEIAGLVLLLAAVHEWWGGLPRAVLSVLAVVFVAFALGRYGDVTAPALYGREVNLYWDVPNMASVVAMLAKVASFWQIAGVILGLVLALTVFYLLARWSLGRLDRAMRETRVRHGFAIAGAVLLACFGVQQLNDDLPKIPRFSIPVSKVYGTQIAKVMDTFSNSRALRALPASPRLQSPLAALNRDDVLLVFEESYGSTTYDRPEFRSFMKPVRERLDAAIRDTGREVVSTFVTSPTFGGNSWFAHISMLTGVEVRDPDRYALLMTQKRATMASMFQGAGYRTIAVMPGLHENWPEGRFYGFNQLYDVNRLDYRGPEFGWWRIPDQYSLAELSLREIQPAPRRPVFVFFPTVSTHMPFRPTPPVQTDWQRVLTTHPYDAAPLKEALSETPEWTNMGRSYIGAVGYFFDTISAYLRARPDDNFVLIILGDHQPAANVSGEGASWDIPVHIIGRNRAVLDALKRSGFEAGLYPTRAPIGRMSDLTPLLVTAFEGAPGERRSVTAR